MQIADRNPSLPDETLDRRRRLPVKPEPVEFRGKYVVLEPLVLDRHLDALYAVSNGSAISLGERSVAPYDPDEKVWRYMPAGPFRSAQDMAVYLGNLIDSKDGLCLCVLDAHTNQPVGAVNYMTNHPAHLKVELGNIWYGPIAQRTGANQEAAYLLLKHAFELGYRRVEWKCDALNERSRRAALRIGFKFEGIQEFHFIVKGKNRDTAWFRMLDHEWSDARAALEQRLYPPGQGI
jgi:RimJ/RimL family protein N-acetyltransferase